MLLSSFIEKRMKTFDKKIEYYEDKVNSNVAAKNIGVPVPEIYYILDNIDDIKSIQLPKNCVIKFNNLASGKGIVFRRGGVFDKFKNIDGVIKFLKNNKSQSQNCQKSIKKIKQKLIIEELLIDETGSFHLIDIKLYYFYGKCYYLYMWEGWIHGPKRHYDTNFKRIKLQKMDDHLKNYHKKPKYWDEIIEYGNKLAEEYFSDTFVRIDFYSTQKGPVFGEFTFNPSGGNGFISKGDRILGKLLK